MRGVASTFGRWLLHAAVVVGAMGTRNAPARADEIVVAPDPSRRGYVPVEELSHEVLVEPGGPGGDVLMRVRVALHNASATSEDFVQLFALPSDSQLVGLRTARGGVWRDDLPVTSDLEGAATEPVDSLPVPDFAAFAAPLAEGPATNGLEGAQLFGWGLAPGETVQAELLIRVQPILRGGRWTLDLPRRGQQQVLAATRRVLVRGGGRRFWVDDQPATQITETRRDDGATVAWPARLGREAGILGSAQAVPRPGTGAGGTLEVFLQAGTSTPRTPDHLAVLLDRSSSVHPGLVPDAWVATEGLVRAHPSLESIDLLSFDRTVRPLLPDPVPSLEPADVRRARVNLGRQEPRAGTDVVAAVLAAIERIPAAARRPTVALFSDGMFPRVNEDATRRLKRALMRTRGGVQVVFIIEDPILARRGLTPDHPATVLAAQLGARIRLVTLSDLEPEDIARLLASPTVIGDVTIRATRQANFTPEATTLIGGQLEILRGDYPGRAPPRTLTARATVRGRRVVATIPVRRVESRGRAFVSASTDIDTLALTPALHVPDWFERGMLEAFRAKLGRAAFASEGRAGTLSQGILGVYLQRHVLPRVRACYNAALARNQTVNGKVILSYQLGKGEVIMSAVSTEALNVRDEKLDACLLEAAWKLNIPAGQLDATRYEITYPIQLTAPEGGRAPSESAPLSPLVEMMLDSAEVLAR